MCQIATWYSHYRRIFPWNTMASLQKIHLRSARSASRLQSPSPRPFQSHPQASVDFKNLAHEETLTEREREIYLFIYVYIYICIGEVFG